MKPLRVVIEVGHGGHDPGAVGSPVPPTEAEVTRLLRSVDNLKHRCILMIIYSAGLRLGELTKLRLTDIRTPASTSHRA